MKEYLNQASSPLEFAICVHLGAVTFEGEFSQGKSKSRGKEDILGMKTKDRYVVHVLRYIDFSLVAFCSFLGC